jgi:hypothetical protein
MLLMLGMVGIITLIVVQVTQALLPVQATRGFATTVNLNESDSAVRLAFRRDGAFPADLTALAARAGLPANGIWRVDPYGRGADLDYRVLATGVRLRSRSIDERINTADDIRVDVFEETPIRVRQRPRLRLLRALLLRSAYRFAGTMSAGEVASMRAATHDNARAKRQWLTATASQRVTLTSTMSTTATTIQSLASSHGCPSLPPALTGTGGLMQQLGKSDSAAIDGQGLAMRTNTALGMYAIGGDRTGASDDDM